jgi:ABC-type transport system involved in cytochrome c biogenesis permease component
MSLESCIYFPCGHCSQSTTATGALMAIMGFPLIIPQLLLLMKISSTAFSSVVQSGWWQYGFLLAGD